MEENLVGSIPLFVDPDVPAICSAIHSSILRGRSIPRGGCEDQAAAISRKLVKNFLIASLIVPMGTCFGFAVD